jgi:hypothetical protein
MKEHLFDKRVVQRALTEGLVDKEAYQRMLEALPDLSHKVQTAAESQALEAASQAASQAAAAPAAAPAAPAYEGAAGSGEYGTGAAPAPSSTGGVSDTLEMERPRIPGSYGNDY